MKNTEIVSCSISKEFKELAKENGISLSEALRVGVSIILAEIGVMEYDNKLNTIKKMRFFIKRSEELQEKLTEAQIKLDKFKY